MDETTLCKLAQLTILQVIESAVRTYVRITFNVPWKSLASIMPRRFLTVFWHNDWRPQEQWMLGPWYGLNAKLPQTSDYKMDVAFKLYKSLISVAAGIHEKSFAHIVCGTLHFSRGARSLDLSSDRFGLLSCGCPGDRKGSPPSCKDILKLPAEYRQVEFCLRYPIAAQLPI